MISTGVENISFHNHRSCNCVCTQLGSSLCHLSALLRSRPTSSNPRSRRRKGSDHRVSAGQTSHQNGQTKLARCIGKTPTKQKSKSDPEATVDAKVKADVDQALEPFNDKLTTGPQDYSILNNILLRAL